jgi:hypothetical protein
MTPYALFKVCEGLKGRRYNGTVDDFDELPLSSYYHSLSSYLYDQVSSKGRVHHKFLTICANEYGSRFDPFELMSSPYLDVYQNWLSINESPESYRKNILKSITFIYDFCVDRDIKTLKKYARSWSASHIISGKMNENVAVILKVHDLKFSKPEKKLLNTKFLKKVKHIQERLEYDTELKKYIESQLGTVIKRLKEINS